MNLKNDSTVDECLAATPHPRAGGAVVDWLGLHLARGPSFVQCNNHFIPLRPRRDDACGSGARKPLRSRLCRQLVLVAALILTLIEAMPTQATPINTNSVSVLALGKSVNSPVVPLGAYVNFYISLTNLGAVAASNIVVQEELPEGLVFIGAMPATGI
jgi:uncharacterized repeat protein (TIGR01451 family)